MKAIAMIIVLAMLTILGETSNPNKQQDYIEIDTTVLETWEKDMPARPPIEELPNCDAEKILKIYSDALYDVESKAKFVKALNKRHLIINGNITSINYDYIDGAWITIRQQRDGGIWDGWVMLVCYFNKDQANNLLKYKEGDKIRFVGYSYVDVGGPNMYDCDIL